MAKEIKALRMEPGKDPFEITISDSLESLQTQVEGYIEYVGLDEKVMAVLNEEGKLCGMEPNAVIYDDSGKPADILVGPIIIAGIDDEDEDSGLCSLTDEQITKYKARYAISKRSTEVCLAMLFCLG